jgi:DNA-binding CsgD family transcriptional regulator
MSLTLTSEDLARCEEASRAMLSPLQAPSVDDWRREVNRTLKALLRADRSMFVLAHEGVRFFSDDMDEDALAAFERVTDPQHTEEVRFREDPVGNLWFKLRRQQHVEAYSEALNTRMVGRPGQRSAFYHEVVVPQRLFDYHGMYVTTTQGDAALWTSYERYGANPFGEGTVALLRALVPAFKAGLAALAQLDAHRHALDGLAEPVMVFDLSGRALHSNTALGQLLAADPEREHVLTALRVAARTLATAGFPRAGRPGPAPVLPAQREVQTQHARYQLNGTLLPAGAFGEGEAVMITVSVRTAPALPGPGELRARYGLTKREAEIVLLLAQGLTNGQLADQLFISPHTARRHTENVLGKLGLHSRKALALKLMQAHHEA